MSSREFTASSGEDNDMEKVVAAGQGLGSLRDQSSCAPLVLQYDSSHATASLEHETWRVPPTLQHESTQVSAESCSSLMSPFLYLETPTSPTPQMPVSQPLQTEPVAQQLVASSHTTTTIAASADRNATLHGAFQTATTATAAERDGAPAAAAALRPEILGARVTLCLAIFRLGIPIDLANLAQVIPNAVGKTHGRGCLSFHRLREPTWKAVVAPSGCVRMFTMYDGELARTAAKQFARLAKKYYSADADFKNYKVSNVAVHANVAFGVDLDGLAANLMEEQTMPMQQKPADPMVPRLRLMAREHGSLKVIVEGMAEGDRTITVLVKQHGSLIVQDAKALREGTCAFDALLPHLTRHSTWW